MPLSERLVQTEILVVDDDPSSLDLLSHLLKQAGHRVRAAPSPELALQSALSFPPELIILDVRMPGMDGFEVTRQLKQDARTAHVPIIFISGQTDVADRVMGFEMGGVDFIIKPFQRDEVLARVRTHLMLHRALDEISTQNKVLEARVRERTADLIRERDLAKCYVEDAPVGIFIADTGGRYRDVNPAGCELVGYSREELLGMSIGDLAPDGDQPSHLNLFTCFMQQGGGSNELSLQKKNGTKILVSLKTVVLADKRVMGFCSDITERRQAEIQAIARAQELDLALQQLHSLSAHMHDSIEKERLAIATDIHDQIGASLTGANLLLNQLNTLTPDMPQAGQEVLAQVQELVSQTLISSRGVYTRLRPPMLNDLGLVETCRWYLQDWAQKSGIIVKQSAFRLPDEPSESIRLDIFRILQELLTNVARHSGATQVSVSLTRRKSHILLKVKDNGQGLDPESAHEGFGLRGIRGRLNRHDGSMQINSTSPGMEVSVQILLNNGEVK
jgi:PAS domain S-box-containing protein